MCLGKALFSFSSKVPHDISLTFITPHSLCECPKTKLRNRRIPNGTYGGVRGQIAGNPAIFLLDFSQPIYQLFRGTVSLYIHSAYED